MSQSLMQEFTDALAQLTGPGAPYELGGSDAQGRFYANAPQLVHEALMSARDHGDREFLIYEDERWTFNELLDAAQAVGAALQARGVGKGERVAIAMRNYPEWLTAFIGIVSIGAIAVPVNSWGQPDDVVGIVRDAGASVVFCDQQRYDGIAGLLDDVQLVIARPLNPEDPNGLALLVRDFEGQAPAAVDIATDDLAMIMYTSGTSGKPKGAASTHRAICQAIFNMECCAIAAAMTNGDLIEAMLGGGYEPTSLLAVPLFHVSGCHAQFFMNLRGGRRIVMMYKWDVNKALDYIEQERVTTVAAAPAMIIDLLESPRFPEADTQSLFSVGIGGAATPPRVSALLEERLPQNFSGTGWGMTETNAQGASMTGKAFHEKAGSAGFPHPIAQFRICDEAGAEQPHGISGEIWVRSPSNVREYWNRPDVNAEEIVDGWLKTGDIGYLDDAGFLYLSDRAKDMIIRGGENIFPVEIENQLLEHPAVKEVAVLGVPHERLGEEVAAVVYLHAGQQAGQDELTAFARERLAAFKVPARFVISAEPLPRNATNKILKHDIRKTMLA